LKTGRVRGVWRDLATTGDEWAKAVALERLWPHLPAELQTQAEAVAGAFRDPWVRADLIAFLSTRVPPAQGRRLLEQAIASARSAPSPWASARALTAVLSRTEG
ncbi:MAG: hypothetical protein ACRDHY_18690, partial [Anaerolineales bacterium]